MKIPRLYDYATTVVGRQISLWVAIQSIKQLEVYGRPTPRRCWTIWTPKFFYRQRRTTAKYLEEELGRRSAYSHSHSTRDGGSETQGMAEQGARHDRQSDQTDAGREDILVFHHNLPPSKPVA